MEPAYDLLSWYLPLFTGTLLCPHPHSPWPHPPLMHAHSLHCQPEGPIQDCASAGGSTEGGERGCLWPVVQQVLGPTREPLCCIIRLLSLGWGGGRFFAVGGCKTWKTFSCRKGLVGWSRSCLLAYAGTCVCTSVLRSAYSTHLPRHPAHGPLGQHSDSPPTPAVGRALLV